MKFNSQICTSRSQSERLLSLGVKKETADIVIRPDNTLIVINENSFIYHNLEKAIQEGYFPAWSLHRLLAMLTYQVIYNDMKYEPVIALDGMAYQDVCNDDPIVGWSGDLYTDVIDCIEWIINAKQFNEEYLK